MVDAALAGAQSANGDRSNARSVVSVAKNPLTVAAGMRRVLYPSVNRLKPKFLAEVQIEMSEIPLSEAKKGFMESEERWYIIDTVQFGPVARARDVLKDVSMLAQKLAQCISTSVPPGFRPNGKVLYATRHIQPRSVSSGDRIVGIVCRVQPGR